jgi:2-polyprenyl-6-methoxyphenol hydroxylase-like FAD-dependent oxidoreductase
MAWGRVALLGDAAFVARPHVGMGVSKAAGDALALADLLQMNRNNIRESLPAYSASRILLGEAVIAHARELGAYLQTWSRSDNAAMAARHNAAHHHTPEAVMREIAVTRTF